MMPSLFPSTSTLYSRPAVGLIAVGFHDSYPFPGAAPTSGSGTATTSGVIATRSANSGVAGVSGRLQLGDQAPLDVGLTGRDGSRTTMGQLLAEGRHKAGLLLVVLRHFG